MKHSCTGLDTGHQESLTHKVNRGHLGQKRADYYCDYYIINIVSLIFPGTQLKYVSMSEFEKIQLKIKPVNLWLCYYHTEKPPSGCLKRYIDNYTIFSSSCMVGFDYEKPLKLRLFWMTHGVTLWAH